MTSLSEEDKAKAVKHLFYELEMLLFTARSLLFEENLKSHDRNAVIESFGIHIRVLRDFFYKDIPKNPKEDKLDIYAQYFMPASVNWSEKRIPSESSNLYDVKTRVDKTIAHLTEDRLIKNFMDQGWKIAESIIELAKPIKAFFDSADKKYFGGPNWPKFHKEWNIFLTQIEKIQKPASTTTSSSTWEGGEYT